MSPLWFHGEWVSGFENPSPWVWNSAAKASSCRRTPYSMRLRTAQRVIPSPLNGEKVAKGRMRGGHAHGSDLQPRLLPIDRHPSPSVPLRESTPLVKSETLVGNPGALGTARPTSAFGSSYVIDFSAPKVGRGVPTAPGLERASARSRDVQGLKARNFSGKSLPAEGRGKIACRRRGLPHSCCFVSIRG